LLLYYREAQRKDRRKQADFVEGIVQALANKQLGKYLDGLRRE